MAKVTTLNTKLPKASQIRWCTDAGKNMSTSISTDENRVFSRKVCFKQGGSTKSNIHWQIKYRWKFRYTPSVAKQKKGEVSDWSSWRTPITFKPYNDEGVKVTVNKNTDKVPDEKYWRVGNRAYVKSSTYNMFANWTSANKAARTMGADYDCIEYQFAVRAIHASSQKHGEWTYQNLKVFRKATIADEVLIGTGSGLQIDFNYISERGGSVSITAIKDSDGNDILKSDIKKAPATDTGRLTKPASNALNWYAYKRSGYTAGQIDISSDNLKRAPEYHEKLTVTGHYITKDNIKTAFAFNNSGYVYGEAAENEIPRPKIDILVDKDTGVVTVTAYKSPEFDGYYGGVKLTDIQCSASYTKNGNKHSFGSFDYDKTDAVKKLNSATGATLTTPLATWKFRPPMNIPVTYSCKVKNELGQYSAKGTKANVITERTETVKGSGYLLNGITYPNVYAAVSYNAEFNWSTETGVMINLPYGRKLPFAVYGGGRVPTFTLKGYSVDNDKTVNKYNKPHHLKRLAQYLGVYLLRNGAGESFKVAVKKVDIDYVRYDVLTVTIEMQEVS